MKTIEKLKNLSEKCKERSAYILEYDYIKSIEYNEDLNFKYGVSRQGFERYREENDVRMRNHSGEISLRRCTKGDEDVGYVAERKVFVRTDRDKLIVEAKAELYNHLEVQDEEAMDAYFLAMTENFEESFYAIDYMITLLERYESEPEFKRMIDKIKG